MSDAINLNTHRLWEMSAHQICYFQVEAQSFLGCAGKTISGFYKPTNNFGSPLYRGVSLEDYLKDTVLAYNSFRHSKNHKNTKEDIDNYSSHFNIDRGQPCKILLCGLGAYNTNIAKRCGFEQIDLLNNSMGGSRGFSLLRLKLATKSQSILLSKDNPLLSKR